MCCATTNGVVKMQLTSKPAQEISFTSLIDASNKTLKSVTQGEVFCSSLLADHTALAEWNTRISEIRKKSSDVLAQ